MQEIRLDTGEIFKYERTPENFLRIWMAVSQVGDLQYYDSMGNPYTEYVDKETLFDSQSLETSWGKPITYGDHPQYPDGSYHLLDSTNAKHDMIGATMQSHLPQEKRLNILAVLFDQEAIAGVESGELQVSAAYGRDVKLDNNRMVQRNRRYNHYSILRKGKNGRAGKDVKVYFDSFKVDILGGAIIHNEKGQIITPNGGDIADRSNDSYNNAKHDQVSAIHLII